MSVPHGQRAKAREMMKAEGYGQHLKHLTVDVVDKNEMVRGNRIGAPEPAKSHRVYEAGELGADGLMRHHAHKA